MPLTRLAPSPTGALHLGNARTFLINWIMARQHGWSVLLRIDDLDGPRIKSGTDQQAIEDLRWLGLDWDQGPIYQSSRTARYGDAVASLLRSGQTYPCICSRKDVERAASAPHAEDGAGVYPGTCRGRFTDIAAATATGRKPALRFDVRQQTITWTDALRGTMTCDVATELGDFVIAKADGVAAYQLATVVDDAELGVTHIVRADDLIDSTPRQILLYQSLGWSDRIPTFYHLPLVIGPDGRRLAKRHGDTRLAFYREQGVSPARVRALLAKWSGIETSDAVEMNELLAKFDMGKMTTEPTVFTAADDAWLRA